MTASGGIGMARASTTKKSASRTEADADLPPRIERVEKRLVAEVPIGIHKQVRIRCMERGILVRDYLLELLARDGIA
jgi:hypothetical protein